MLKKAGTAEIYIPHPNLSPPHSLRVKLVNEESPFSRALLKKI